MTRQGGSYFHYKQGKLFCEQVPVEEIVRAVGSPVYIYSYRSFTERYAELAAAFRSVNPLICFSMKANSNLAVLRALTRKGAGLDIVSGGELFRALTVGCSPKKIVFAGVGKTDREISAAIDKGILLFNVESIPELEAINRIAGRKKKKVDVSLRVNPHVKPKTHRHITTGHKESKFGIDLNFAFGIYTDPERFPHVRISGVHVHIGSQITKGDPFVRALKKVLAFIDRLERQGVMIKYLNFGGGLGVIYKDEKPQTAAAFARRILPLIKKTRFGGGRNQKGQMIFEPGRFIAANSGIFVTKVVYVKKTQAKNFLIVDGAMNDLIRPSLYEAYHELLPVAKSNGRKALRSDVVGPICESGDYFAKDRLLPVMQREDLIAVMSAGAYGFTMAGTYNSRPLTAEVMVKGKSFEVIRRRDTYQDLVRKEKIPAFIK